MSSLEVTVREYRKSCAKLRRRIAELSGEIAEKRGAESTREAQELEARRYLLYDELAHMEQSIMEMRGYLTKD